MTFIHLFSLCIYRFETWLKLKEAGYCCEEERALFEDSGLRKHTDVSDEIKKMILERIAEVSQSGNIYPSFIERKYKYFHKNVYNNLQVVEIYGKPWTDDTMNECIYDAIFRKVYDYTREYRKFSLEVKWLKKFLENTYQKIYIRVGGEGSKYCHNFRRPGGEPSGITHKHRSIYFIIERVHIYHALIYQCCFGNDSINNRNPCNTDKPHRVRVHFADYGDDSRLDGKLFFTLFGDHIDLDDSDFPDKDCTVDGGSEKKECTTTTDST